MADLVGIGGSALLAYRTALDVIGHNIANANTDGYSRQRVDLQTAVPTPSSRGTLGSGVTVNTIERLNEAFAQVRLLGDESGYARAKLLDSYATQLDALMSDSSTGLSGPLQSFFDSLSALSADPTSTAARQQVIASAQSLAGRFNDLQQQLDSFATEADSQVSAAVDGINGLTSQIAQLNTRISSATFQAGGQAPNDLLDQRDQLLRQLAGQIGITTTSNADGTINVALANGEALVRGPQSFKLSVGSDAYGRQREILLHSSAVPTDITRQISGGALGGVLDFERELLDPAMDGLGRIALGLSQAVNAQQSTGMDQYGQLGGAMFSLPAPTVIAAAGNGGNAVPAGSVTDPDALGDGEYLLSYSGAVWQLTDASSGAQIALSGDGSPGNPLRGGGLSLTVSGTPAAGDKYLVQPARFAAGELAVILSDPARIAAASPIQTVAASSNSGSAAISSRQVLDASDPNLLQSVQISFTSATTYSINGAGSYSYSDGGNIDVNGWRVQISGLPAAGDSFTVRASSGGSSDNGNAVALTGLASRKLLDGGKNTISSANAALVAGVGTQAQQAGAQLSAQSALREQAQSARDAVSGVNLDEEAADLLRFQQAYQAAAQVVATANTLFESLLSAVQR
jgi:flagellar hook-associated protein 1 FlgK